MYVDLGGGDGGGGRQQIVISVSYTEGNTPRPAQTKTNFKSRLSASV